MNQQEPAAKPSADEAMSEPEIIARNLDRLFQERRAAEGRKVPREDVADYASEIVGSPVNRVWVSKLLNGEIAAPDPTRLDAVARFFGKTAAWLRAKNPDWLEGDDARGAVVEEWREIAAMVNDLGAQGVNLRQLHDLSPEDLGVVRTLVERLAATDKQRREG